MADKPDLIDQPIPQTGADDVGVVEMPSASTAPITKKCDRCSRVHAGSRKTCDPCRRKVSEEGKRRRDERNAAGLCADCGEQPKLPDKTICGGCKQRRHEDYRRRFEAKAVKEDQALYGDGPRPWDALPDTHPKTGKPYDKRRYWHKQQAQNEINARPEMHGIRSAAAAKWQAEPGRAEEASARSKAAWERRRAAGFTRKMPVKSADRTPEQKREINEARNERRKAWTEAGLCRECGKHPRRPVEGATLCEGCAEYKKRQSVKQRKAAADREDQNLYGDGPRPWDFLPDLHPRTGKPYNKREYWLVSSKAKERQSTAEWREAAAQRAAERWDRGEGHRRMVEDMQRRRGLPVIDTRGDKKIKRKHRYAAGYCYDCSNPRRPDSILCADCTAKKKEEHQRRKERRNEANDQKKYGDGPRPWDGLPDLHPKTGKPYDKREFWHRSQAIKALWADPAYAEEHSARLKEGWAQNKEERLARQRKKWEDPEYREWRIRVVQESLADPEVKARQSAGIKAAYQRPEVAIPHSKRMKEVAKRPEIIEAKRLTMLSRPQWAYQRGGDVYLIRNTRTGELKLGSSERTKERLVELARGYRNFARKGDRLELVRRYPCDYYRRVEHRAHELLGMDEYYRASYGEVVPAGYDAMDAMDAIEQAIREIDGEDHT